VARIKRFLLTWLAAFAEAGVCILRGMLDTFRDGLWWRSAGWFLLVLGFWLFLYIHYAKFFLLLAAGTSAIAIYGLILGGALSFGAAAGGSVVAMANVAPMVQAVLAALALSAILYVLIFVTGFLTTVRLPVRWLLLERAKTIVARSYPQWNPVPMTPRHYSAWDYVKIPLMILLALCIPVWALFMLLYLAITMNVDLIYGPAAKGILSKEDRHALQEGQGKPIFVLGLLIFLLLFIPFIQLLVPALLCTSVAHLQRRGWTADRYRALHPLPGDALKAAGRTPTCSVPYPFLEMLICHAQLLIVLSWITFVLVVANRTEPDLDWIYSMFDTALWAGYAISIVYGIPRIIWIKIRGPRLVGWLIGLLLVPMIMLPILFWSRLWPARATKTMA
jgi:hypothetical protein